MQSPFSSSQIDMKGTRNLVPWNIHGNNRKEEEQGQQQGKLTGVHLVKK